MKKLSNFIFIAFFAMMMASCSDDGNITLNITAPSDGTVITAGTSFDITGTATDDVALVSAKLENSDLGLNETLTLSGTSTSFTFTITLAENTEKKDYKIEITITDDEGNTKSEKVKITVN